AQARAPEAKLGPRREAPLDAARVLKALDEHAVDYTLIGGLAVQAHGHTRTTQDIDIVPAPDAANLERLVEVLRARGASRWGAIGGASRGVGRHARHGSTQLARHGCGRCGHPSAPPWRRAVRRDSGARAGDR